MKRVLVEAVDHVVHVALRTHPAEAETLCGKVVQFTVAWVIPWAGPEREPCSSGSVSCPGCFGGRSRHAP